MCCVIMEKGGNHLVPECSSINIHSFWLTPSHKIFKDFRTIVSSRILEIFWKNFFSELTITFPLLSGASFFFPVSYWIWSKHLSCSWILGKIVCNCQGNVGKIVGSHGNVATGMLPTIFPKVFSLKRGEKCSAKSEN